MAVKFIKDAKIGEVIGLSHRGLGIQWVVVEAIEVGEEKTKITVKFPKHVGGVIVTKNVKNEKRVNWQTREDFDSWCKVNQLTPF